MRRTDKGVGQDATSAQETSHGGLPGPAMWRAWVGYPALATPRVACMRRSSRAGFVPIVGVRLPGTSRTRRPG